MLRRIASLRRSGFVRSASTLVSGQMLGTAIGFAAAPILGRLYRPEDYGVLATYMALAVVIGAMANFQMSRAVVSESDERRALALLALSLNLALLTSLATLVVVLVLVLGLATAPPALGWWLLLLPATILAAGTGSALIGWANRHHRYRLMSGFQIINVVFASGGAILLGLLDFGPPGLMIGYFLGQLFSFLLVLAGNRDAVAAVRSVNWREMRAAGAAHRNYALWTTPTAMIEQISGSAPVFVLSFWGNMLAVVGHFNRARGLVALPVGILGGAIGQIFFRRAAQDRSAFGHCRPLFWKLVVGLAAISIPGFALLAWIAPTFFTILLGPAWYDAGHIARILAPVMALQLVVMPASKILWIYDRQRLDFGLSITFTTATTLAVLGVAVSGYPPIMAIYAFAAMQILLYLSYLICCIWIVEKTPVPASDP